MSSTLRSPPTPARPPERLAHLCLEHVAREQEQLDATLTSVRDVRAALLGKDPTALAAALARHEDAARRDEALSVRRAAFQEEAADILDVPAAAVTLDLLAARLPADAAAHVADARARLRQQAAAVGQLNASNASLLYHSLDFLRRFFDGLTGAVRDGRYGPAGAPAATSLGSLIDARG